MAGATPDSGKSGIQVCAPYGPNPTRRQCLRVKQEAAIHEALGHLGQHYRSIIVLRDIEDFSYTDIAEVLGISIDAVRSGLSREERF